MDLAKALLCIKSATTNLFHHSQVFHKDYGLVWHNGKSVYISQLEFCPEVNQPKPACPALTLGQFDNVVSVCWSRESTGTSTSSSNDDAAIISHLCVQHLEHVTIWEVTGRNINLKCKKQAEHQVKSLPQGCLWHPRKSVLCVLSHTELHVYNTQNTNWDVIQCDGKVTAGCWGRDGSKFILALGSEVKELAFNPQTQSLEFPTDGNNKTRIQSLQSHTSIKSMTPVTNDLVAIVTDLPLDHLIYQSHQGSPCMASMKKSLPQPLTDQPGQINKFSLIIPKNQIIPNPIVEMLKNYKPCDSFNVCKADKTPPTSPTISLSQEESEQSPSSITVENKLDQILNLMKRMPETIPNEPGSRLQTERKTTPSILRSKVECTMQDGSRSGPIDITAMINETQGSKFNSFVHELSGDDMHTKERTMKDTQHADSKSNIESNVRTSQANGHSNCYHGNKHDDRMAANVPRSTHSALQSNRDTVTGLIESELKGRHSGPLDVTALLRAKSGAQNSLAGIREGVEGGREDEKEDIVDMGRKRAFAGADVVQKSEDDIIDLTGLKTNNKVERSVSQTVEMKHTSDSPDAAKLSLIHMGGSEGPISMTSVDLPGILTPDLLHFQESAQCFVVGTNTQRQLLVYRLHDNKLEPAKGNIMLPDLHRPLGVCDIPGYPSDILVLAGESQPTDGAFLTISSRTEMNLKLMKYDLHLKQKSGMRANHGGVANRCTRSHASPGATGLPDNAPDSFTNVQLDPEIRNTSLFHEATVTSKHNLSQPDISKACKTSTNPSPQQNGHTRPSSSVVRQSSRSRTTSPRLRLQGGWRSYSHEIGNVASKRDHQVERSKYPYPQDADLVHFVCKGAENKPTVLKTFILHEQMIKLQDIKDALGLNSVEMKIRDNWVVLTEDSSGYIPLCLTPNSSHTIKENEKSKENS